MKSPRTNVRLVPIFVLITQAIQISGSAAVDKDDRIYLICNATGLEYPPEDLDWFFEGIKLATNADEKVLLLS